MIWLLKVITLKKTEGEGVRHTQEQVAGRQWLKLRETEALFSPTPATSQPQVGRGKGRFFFSKGFLQEYTAF